MRDDPPRGVIIATGALTLPDDGGPEKSLRQLDAEALVEAFRINAVGPAPIAKHFLPLLRREGHSVFAALGARVGSIGDNRLGGWHGYRASKAALAMLLRNFAIEMDRTHPDCVVAGLHPATVATPLSAPFRGAVAGEGMLTPEQSAAHLLDVLERLEPADSGAVFDLRGARVEP